MSGFEVGGIVLAVFPLVVGAIERILANESSFRLWEAQACRLELESIQLEVQIQQTLFQNSYLKLLSSFLDRCQTVKILADPDGLRKHHLLITTQMKNHLGEQWTVYQAVMRRLENTLQAFKASVDKAMTIDENGDELPKLKLLLHRIRFSLYTRQRSGLLKRLKDDNQTLATLTDQQRTLKVLGTHEHPHVTVDVAACSKMHQQVVDVFDSLASNVATNSEYWVAHAASILFTSFVASGFPDRPNFSFVLNGLDQDGVSRSIDCRIARCSATEHKYLSICSSYQSLHVPRDNLSTHSKSQHRWSAPPPIQGCLRSPAEPFEEYILKLKTIVETPTSISLAGIVSADRTFACYPCYFLENDRAKLAATLALSLLCLHDSPWLKSSWSSRDLLFQTASGDVSSESLWRPYTKVAFPHATIQSEPQSTADIDTQHSMSTQFGILNQSLYSLGMVLLELIMNETLESAKQRDDETEHEVAWRLEREVCGRAGPRWADIVFACLHCPFQRTPDLANEDFLQVVALNIVMPLIEMAQLRLNYAEPD